MAIINKIREKSGIAVGVIGLGLALFVVGGDLFSPNSRILGRNKQIVGEVAGEEISLQQYQGLIDQIRSQYPTPPNEAQMAQIREMAWAQLVNSIALKKEMESLGITVTDEELQDMIKGNNISAAFGRYFMDSTGQVDKKAIAQYLGSLKNAGSNSPEYQQFLMMQEQIRDGRASEKYVGLFALSNNANSLEGKKEYKRQNDKAEVVYLAVPYTALPDSVVEVSESDVKSYYNANKNKYKRDAVRGIEFVTFSAQPSANDIALIERDLAQLKDEFKAAANDSAFVASHTDGNAQPMTVNATGVPTVMDIAQLQQGEVYGPYNVGGVSRLYKVQRVGTDTTFAARASHILFSTQGKSDTEKAAIKAKAQQVLDRARAGENFAQLAAQYGEDGTRSRGGDLNWFTRGQMVRPFENAVFNAPVGLIPTLVETDFGYHVVKVTAPRTNKKVTLAVVEKAVDASDATINQAYRKAAAFAATAKNRKQFEAVAQKDSMFIEQALSIAPSAQYINSLTGAEVRSVVRWAYNEDTDVDDVSEVFNIGDRYIVATLIEASEEGVQPLKLVEPEVRSEVIKQKKADYIVKKLEGINMGDFNAAAAKFGAGAFAGMEGELAPGAMVIDGVGYAPKTIGTVFGMANGKVSKPIKDENAVIVVKVNNLLSAPETADYGIYQRQIADRKMGATQYQIMEAIKEIHDVKDNRHLFY